MKSSGCLLEVNISVDSCRDKLLGLRQLQKVSTGKRQHAVILEHGSSELSERSALQHLHGDGPPVVTLGITSGILCQGRHSYLSRR